MIASSFGDFIRECGYEPPDRIEPGRWVSFSANGKRSNTAGRCKLFADGEGGIVYDWRSGDCQVWQAKRLADRTPEAAQRWREKIERDKREAAADREREAQASRERARTLWEQARPADDSHPYLRAKGVKCHGLRLYRGPLALREMRCDGALMIPRRDAAGVVVSLQFIAPNGEKRYLAGPTTAGSYFSLGKPDGSVCIAEGYATAATLHEATGLAVAVAFDAGNLEATAKAMREKFPAARLIMCADDDWRTKRPDGSHWNPGWEAALSAALAVGGLLAVPAFPDSRGEADTDFNDMARLVGREGVEKAVEDARQPTNGPEGPPSVANAVAAVLDDPWPVPKPIEAPLLPVPAFDAEVLLPPALAEFVMDEADRMPSCPDLIAAPLITALGAMIGARCVIKPKSKDDWVVPANLWGGIVASASTKKSPCIAAGLKGFERVAAKALEDHKRKLTEYETLKTIHDAKADALQQKLKAAARDPKNGNVNEIGSQLTGLHENGAADEPKPPRFKTNDSSVEKLGELLAENERGILITRDELVGLLASWEREGREGDRAFMLEAWNGTSGFDTDRIGRGSIFVKNLCVSIFGGIQPDKLVGYLEEAANALGNDGMLARFQMLVYPDERRWEWRDRLPNKAARDQVFAIFESLAAFDPEEWGALPADDFVRFPSFRFDDEAQRIFVEWSCELHAKIPDENSPLVAQHLAKYDKLFPTLALIFHLVESAESQRSPVVGADSAIRAAAWCDYLEAHARRCYGLLADSGLRAARTLADKLRRGFLEDGFTARDVRRHQWRNLTSDHAVDAALDWLADEDWLRGEETGGTGPGTGRRTTRYAINPRIRNGGAND